MLRLVLILGIHKLGEVFMFPSGFVGDKYLLFIAGGTDSSEMRILMSKRSS